jgi:GT2 family glycosyltransferase
MKENPLISVIVLNWNGRQFLEQCLGSILAQTYHPLEVILVDNGSTDGSLEFVKATYPDVRVIANGKNLGYGGGNNVGIQSSRGQYVMILNNDTRLDLGCIEELKRSIEKKDRYGACASKILFEHAGLRIDAAGLVVCPDGLAIGRGRWDREDRYDTETEVFCASGCACLFRREMLEEIGIYDEDFFAYGEDTDLGWRAQLAGWRCIYSPKAVVHHLHSASSGTYSHFKAYLVERNRIWVSLKNFPLPLVILGQFYTLWRYVWQAYGAFTGAGAAGRFTRDFSKRALVKVLMKVYLTFWQGLPLMLKKRKGIQEKRRISKRDVYTLLRQYGISAKEVALRE